MIKKTDKSPSIDTVCVKEAISGQVARSQQGRCDGQWGMVVRKCTALTTTPDPQQLTTKHFKVFMQVLRGMQVGRSHRVQQQCSQQCSSSTDRAVVTWIDTTRSKSNNL
jgi:hypothetical protein